MSLPTHDEAEARATEGSPFSNGSEGECWMADNCNKCVHDKPARSGDYENACPVLLVAFLGKTPAEWLDKGMGDYTCLYFRDEDNGGSGEPTPIPDPPGQLTLCPREPYERTARMFTDTKPALVDA